jgi:pantoate--beta-alanine ligase
MIYINPTQFTVHEDFNAYPRSMQADALLLQQAGASAIFAPATFYHVVDQAEDQIAAAAAANGAAGSSAGSAADADKAHVVGQDSKQHPLAHETWVTVERMQQGLCGPSRPHLFRGIATIW